MIRGALDKDFSGKTFRILCTAADATTISALMMMTPEHTINERRKTGKLEGEDLEAFGEVGNVVCSGIDGKLREHLGGGIGLRLGDFGLIAPRSDPDELLGDEEFIAFRFNAKIGDYPEAPMSILVDTETAEKWNGQPFSGPSASGPSATTTDDVSDSFGSVSVEKAVPIRGKIGCYLADSETFDHVRASCRRAGLEVDNRPTSEVPNPAAYRGRLVLIDIPVRSDRRFDWCRRLKEYEPSCRVALIIREPSRQRIVLGFLAKADIIVGWPLDDDTLTNKLNAVMDELTSSSPGSDPDSDSNGPE